MLFIGFDARPRPQIAAMRALARLPLRALRSPCGSARPPAPSATRSSHWRAPAPLSPPLAALNSLWKPQIGPKRPQFGSKCPPFGPRSSKFDAKWASTLRDEHSLANTTRAVVRGGSAPVLRFDATGEGVVLELSRAELLHRTQEAAVPVEHQDQQEPNEAKSSKSSKRGDPLDIQVGIWVFAASGEVRS